MPAFMVSFIAPSVPIDAPETGVIAIVRAVPAEIQPLFTVTLIFPLAAAQSKL